MHKVEKIKGTFISDVKGTWYQGVMYLNIFEDLDLSA